jgi:hypothetical protein
MEYIRIRRLDESDFDDIVKAAGGSRIPEDGSADYELGAAFVELKLVEEEGLEKRTRQAKLADLFKQLRPAAPTIALLPETLGSAGARAYYNILSGPLKTHVKKAADQLSRTRERRNTVASRVLVIINNGYGALSHDEFKAICLKCVQNDTTRIDWLVCGGLYYYSDQFDSYLIAPLEVLPVNIGEIVPELTDLQREWGNLSEKIATEMIMAPQVAENARMPVLDLVFEVDGVRYVKPAPEMPASSFWPDGKRPRDNSTGIAEYPPVALTFPMFDEPNWAKFKGSLEDVRLLQDEYADYLAFASYEERKRDQLLKPFVPIDVKFEDFVKWASESMVQMNFKTVCEFTRYLFQQQMLRLLGPCIEGTEPSVIPVDYIRCDICEIGQDQANDYASITYVSELPGFEREEIIVENARLYFEPAIKLAGAYAIKRKLEAVRCRKVIE